MDDLDGNGRGPHLHPQDDRRPARPVGQERDRVLILCDDADLKEIVDLSLPIDVYRYAVRTSSDTEGLGVRVVVIATRDPWAELAQVRVHPNLHATSCVVFVPASPPTSVGHGNGDGVRVVAGTDDPIGDLVRAVRGFLGRDGSHAHPASAATPAAIVREARGSDR